ncbi:hydroxyisourate hydrolase [Marinomonas sp. TW1]|uniref:hydroxyisourate hydrolase n=1 Tax=Marinomonas sp. TW1 TaxID=1561203 RepID=UPI0007AF4125|nr:hydroxyisourate hydrolase [Marinomonas sp. TW1]KZN15470.1 5-hydroxyisourate hydrolase [Marinomonas sp. TW1]
MGYLTTHILDTTKGIAAAGVNIQLFRHNHHGQKELIHSTTSNADGRCDAPLLDKQDFVCGVYELEFAIEDYFLQQGVPLPSPSFLNVVNIRFGISDDSSHYHIPLLVSPYSYSTYRGS